MDTGSRASSSTDAVAAGEESPDRAGDPGDQIVQPSAAGAGPRAPADVDAASVNRRSFFRVFSRQTVTTVAQVAGIAGAVQRGTAAAVVEAVNLGFGDPSGTAARLTAQGPALGQGASAAEPGTALAGQARFHSAFRVTDDALVLLDQRLLPGRVDEITCVRAADVAFQMRTWACSGATLLAQLAAYGMALTAREAQGWPRSRRDAELRRAGQLLLHARPTVQPVAAAVERMQRAAATAAGPDPEGEDAAAGVRIALALRGEADSIAEEAALATAAVARATADFLRPSVGTPLGVLVVGDPGQLTSGQVGMGITCLQLLKQSGVNLHVWVAAGLPRGEGTRLGSWELANAGIDHAVVPDAAIAWLMATEPIDAVLLSADRISAGHDAIVEVGARQVAELAALRLGATQTRVVVLATSDAIAQEGSESTESPGAAASPHSVDTASGVRVTHPEPRTEMLRATLISAIITERGTELAPFPDSPREGS
jgi:methylthioribose-1-phosphate isomerase